MARTKAAFLAAVRKEYAGSNRRWLMKITAPAANEVQTTSVRFAANETERDLIQQMGNAYGCHTCDTMIENTPPRYIVDHIPPREMMGKAGDRSSYRFFAHCDSCASEQSALVRKYAQSKDEDKLKVRRIVRGVGHDPSKKNLLAAKVQLRALGLKDKELELLCGGRFDRSIRGRYGKPSESERAQVNAKGRAYGCHVCGSTTPLRTYHADHCPPREFGMTSWFPKLMEKLGGPSATRWSFRPQCPDCSHKQGARCRALVTEAETHFLPGSQVTRYK